MERDDGFMFDCRIPPFSLESKQDDPTTNGGDPNGPVIIGNWYGGSIGFTIAHQFTQVLIIERQIGKLIWGA